MWNQMIQVHDCWRDDVMSSNHFAHLRNQSTPRRLIRWRLFVNIARLIRWRLFVNIARLIRWRLFVNIAPVRIHDLGAFQTSRVVFGTLSSISTTIKPETCFTLRITHTQLTLQNIYNGSESLGNIQTQSTFYNITIHSTDHRYSTSNLLHQLIVVNL